MEKKRYEIEVAGVQLAIISDEREEFVKTLVENLDREIREITVKTKRSSNLDAAILCALEYYSEKLKAEKRARNLEAQISLYDANLRRFREENIALREKLEALGKKEPEKEAAEEDVTEAEALEEEPAADEVKEAPEAEAAEVQLSLDDSGSTEPEEKSEPADDTRAARLRAIEELLGRSGKKD